MAVAGMVLGILAVALCWFPVVNWILAILAIIFGGVGISKGNRVGRGKGMAIAGLICGLISAVMGIAFIVFIAKSGDAISKGVKHFERDFARETVKKYVIEGYPSWQAKHPEQKCPDKLSDLDQYTAALGGLDPWGEPYKMHCGADGFSVSSSGPDREDGTSDDIKAP